MYTAYRRECREGRFKPGSVFVWDALEATIFNLATQPIPGPFARLRYLEASLRKAVRIAEARLIPVIGMPRIGAGNGGLDWVEIRRSLELIANDTAVVLAVYELPKQ
jgi:O-acetyl-ADP-ribose deacetylase (regulator of RNase III)